MATLAEKLLENGIRLRSHNEGNYKITCPKCSRDRKNASDPCLSVTIDELGAKWKCHNCNWTDGIIVKSERYRPPHRPRPVKPTIAPSGPTAALTAWFLARGISEATIKRNQIGFARHWIPALNAEADCIAFPYYREGELINVKFRSLSTKAFAQEKGAEKILYGLDDITDQKSAIIVEGELDKLALEEAGYRNVLSVPDGAPAVVKEGPADLNDRKFEYLGNCAEQLHRLERIILAVDADGPGQALEEELARRLGKERCWRVRWPDSNDTPCKDANEVLQVHGPQVLAECIKAAAPYPIEGLHSVDDYAAETLTLYRDGRKRGHSTGWSSLDEYMTIRDGELSLVTGVPNSGKSEFIDALMVNLAKRYGWRFGVCSFENPPNEHISKLAEKYLGLPFWDGPTQRMSEAELRRGMDWVGEHFHLIRFDDHAPTIDAALDVAKAAVLRHGIRGLVLDPYNEFEHKRPSNQTETEYVSQTLGRVKRFAQSHGVHVWFVAHPAKPPRDDAKSYVPTLYDVSGSANWANKADIGMVVHRPDPTGTITDVHIRKVRFKSVGKLGVTSLKYDRATGRYSELPTAARTGSARAYVEN